MATVGDVFAMLLLGHLVGDYLLQPTKMAVLKSTPGRTGRYNCIIHCAIYTASVVFSMCLLFGFHILTIIAMTIVVFNSHFWIDRYSLGDAWSTRVRGDISLMEALSPGTLITARTYFAPLIYVVTDNTMHLVLMTAAVMAMQKWSIL